jgi:hypothetical protein
LERVNGTSYQLIGLAELSWRALYSERKKEKRKNKQQITLQLVRPQARTRLEEARHGNPKPEPTFFARSHFLPNSHTSKIRNLLNLSRR